MSLSLTDRQRRILTGSLIAVGLGLVGLLGAEPYVTHRRGDEPPNQVFFVLACVGLGLVIAGVLSWLAVRVRLPSRFSGIECYRAKRSELGAIRQMAVDHFGDPDVSSISRMNRWHDTNKNIFWVFVRVRRDTVHVEKHCVGYFCLIPLRADAARRVREGQLTGSQLLPTDIAPSGHEKCAAVYLGAVVALGRKARGIALSHVHSHLTHYWRKRTPLILTRPVTADGLRVAKKYGFTPEAGSGKGQLGELFELQSTPSPAKN